MWQEMREMREEMKEQGEKIREEMEELRRDYKEQIEKWKEEKEEMRKNMERNKDKDFWKGLEEWEVIVLTETWMEEKSWKKVRRMLPKGYIWGVQGASRKNERGRAIGGMIMGMRKEIAEKGEEMEMEKEGFAIGRVKVGGERWRVIGIYAGQGIEKACKEMEQWTEEKENEVYTIIGGDFNARTGEEGGRVRGEENVEEEGLGESKRKSKDRVINAEGRKLLEFLGEKGWSILNGNTEGDEEGEWTFTGGRGNTVIDYVLGDEDSREKVKKLRVKDKVDSDHQPVEVEIKGKQRKERRKNRGGRRGGTWNEERCRRFKEKVGELEGGEEEIEGEWKKMEERVKEAMKVTEEEERKMKKERRGWWDEECGERKRK
ncbi:golgin subfamily A member 6-like protein 22, partial [Nylanderia fulva]|uniref:golgin subfamily A member 6-like protein 22 n=1 Tax=Nylanderia fulva TaxID=613905 RepID=UPI0010FBAA84